jgi:proteasome accessory factor B
MLFIHDQLKRNRYPNCRSLAETLELRATRTVLRDIQFMQDQLLLPIEYDLKRHGYYYTRPVDQFPGVSVSESELFSLLVAQKAVAQYHGTPFHKPLRTAFQKLTANLDPEAVLHLVDLGEAMDIRVTGPEELNEENFRIATRAVQQHRPLRFRYRKHASRTHETRSIHPYQLVCTNNRWYLVGHDLRRKALRAFVVSRMKRPELLPGVFERPAHFRIQEYLERSFGIFKGTGDFEVVIDLDRWGADVMRGRRWHSSQRVTELPGGEIRISFHLDNLEEIESWVLGWGAHATVVRPRLLADRVLAVAQAIESRYLASPQPGNLTGFAQKKIQALSGPHGVDTARCRL